MMFSTYCAKQHWGTVLRSHKTAVALLLLEVAVAAAVAVEVAVAVAVGTFFVVVVSRKHQFQETASFLSPRSEEGIQLASFLT